MRARRAEFAKEKGLVEQILYEGTLKMIDMGNDVITENAFRNGLAWSME